VRRFARPLLYLGTVLAVLGFGRYHAEYVGGYVLHSSSRLPWEVAYAGLLCLAAYAAGLPDLRRGRRAALAAAAGATGAAAGVVSLGQLLLGSLLLPRFVVLSAALVLVPWYALSALLASDGRDRDEGRDRVVAVVGGEEAAALAQELRRAPERHAALVAVLDPAEARPEGGRRPLFDTALAAGATVVVLDRDAQGDDTVVEQAAQLHEAGVTRVRTLTLFYDEWLGKLPLSELERVSLMFDIGELHRARYGRWKRLLDIVVGASGLVVLAAAVPVVALANRIANRGPLWFRQERVGRNGSVFTILKLRTMTPAAGSGGAGGGGDWTAEDDPRVTPFGRWLRRTHLDELPQAWNILRGDLSIVGPRPEQPRYVDELTEKLPFYQLRHLVRPGVTGWAQVKYDYGSSLGDALEKLQYEFWYLRHQDMALDARIIGRTVRSVAGRAGR
jgi:lipopolysaccharide/colanic/teichoic acid biosynthesis glycosyltransferase